MKNSFYDVVVIGSGAAGLASALALKEMGHSPIVLEKAERLGGGTVVSQGGLWFGNNHLATDAGYADSREQVLAYMRFIGGGETDEEKFLAFIDRGTEALRFFEQTGIKFGFFSGMADHYYPAVDGTAAIGRLLEPEPISADELGTWAERVLIPANVPLEPTGAELLAWGGFMDATNWDQRVINERRSKRMWSRGVALVAHFLKQLILRNVPIETSSPVDRLLFENGKVCGVVAGNRTIKSNAVVIATGGYESNPDLVRTYEGLPGWLSMFPPTLTGDGLIMGTEIGSAVRTIHNNMGLFLGFNIPSDRPGEPPSFRLSGIIELLCPHTIVVNGRGFRFADESYFQSLVPELRRYDTKLHTYANLPCYLIFDDQFRQKFSFAGRPVGSEIPSWVERADSLDGLAQLLDIQGDSLRATVEEFNGYAQTGVDGRYNRGRSECNLGRPVASNEFANAALGPLKSPPFYGIELHPSAWASAGLLTDSSARVLHTRGHPIPGLYAVGNAAAHTEYGVGYQAGHSLASAITFAYLAAESIRASVRQGPRSETAKRTRKTGSRQNA